MTKKNLATPAKIPAQTWLLKDPFNLFFVGAYLAGVLLVLLTPLDVLDKYPQARVFADFMANLIPQIENVARIGGPAAQANRLVYSVLWVVSPVVVCAVAFDTYKKDVFNTPVFFDSTKQMIFLLLGWLLIWPFVILKVFPLDFAVASGLNSKFARGFFLSTVGRTFWSPMLVWGIALLTVAWPFLVYRLVKAWMLGKLFIKGKKND